ncbi:alanine--tRNA ligase [Actinomycetota bacterium]|nr:alanine--tRNA ligase [Actinomycetota bacterium]
MNFFETKGHTVVKSASLVSPDPTTLFTIAGMVPFIPYMTGQQTAPWRRATSVQKCVRTADIDEVGKTTRHGTFFQMNGNFSFGDYFKKEVIGWAWELITGTLDDGCYEFEKDRIWVTVWEDDDEAYDRWLEVGLPEAHLQRRGKEENFWSTGGPGPAGPCSEIFFDRGPEFGEEGGPEHDDLVGTERYLEIWNLVFMQWQIDTVKSKYDFNVVGDLKQKNIDTGMGLERVAFLLQDKQNIFEIDEIYPVIEKVEALTGKTYGENNDDDVHMRILADHIRSSLMIISDGVVPSNEGRGYVLRRLMRRCVRSIKLLGYDEPSFEQLFSTSFKAMKASYAELEEQYDNIIAVVLKEEQIFSRTLKAGSAFLDTAIKTAGKGGIISGEDAFKLHDTHGFPVELTLEIAQQAGVKVDEKAFKEAMTEQRERARADALAKRGAAADVSTYSAVAKELAEKLKADPKTAVGNNAGISEFLGYDVLEEEVRVVGILTDKGPVPTVSASSAGAGGENPVAVEVILDRTPFYAQSGGQLADQGTIRTGSGAYLEVDDVLKPIPELSVHKARLISGRLDLDDTAWASVDPDRRFNIAKAHTSTHIIHKALHEFVGEGATQAGSENSPGRVRFDFKHSEQIKPDVLKLIEERANEKVRENTKVGAEHMSIKTAQSKGAMALFGEKYGDRVRVVSLGRTDSDNNTDTENDWSIELCGGTHVKSTGDIGQITLLGEGSIGSGVRRVDALVGSNATRFAAKEHALVGQISQILGTKDPGEVVGRIQGLMEKLKDAEKSQAAAAAKALLEKVPEAIKNAKTKDGVDFVILNAGTVGSADALREAALDARSRVGEAKPTVVIFAGVVNEKPSVVVATNAAARESGASAGDYVRNISKQLGGGGGGKPDLAQGGGQDASKLDEVLSAPC